jgi:parallel beta-helix repeat protein
MSTSLFRRLFRSVQKPVQARRNLSRLDLRVELLEDRAVPSVVPVNYETPNGWQLTASGPGGAALPAPSAVFENGPSAPPLGTGSLELRIGTDGDLSAQARLTSFAGTQLSDLTALSYSTFVELNNGGNPGNGGQAPYLILNVDKTGDGAVDDLLFFEPIYQNSTFFPSNPQGPLALNTWQSWDALQGGWYAIDATTGNPTFGGPGTNVDQFADYVAANPTAKIVNSGSGLGGLRVVTGFGAGAWDNFIGNADNVTVNTTTYDFGATPTTVYVNDDFANPTLGEDPDGTGPAQSFGFDSFATIQDGVNGVATGGTVNVLAGTYAGGVTVDKSVTIQQSGAGTATVGTGDFSAAINNANGTGSFAVLADSVAIRGLTLQGDGTSASNYGVFIASGSDSVTVSHNTINGFAKNGVTTEFGGGSSNLLIECNTISDVGSVGIYLQTGANNTVTNNTVTGGHAQLTIDSETNDVVTGNTFTGGDIGVELFESLGTGTLTGTKLNYNNITGHSTAGVQNFGSTAVNARFNWWDAVSGPTNAGNPGGTGDAVIGNVDYAAWLLAPVGTASVSFFTDTAGNVLIVDAATGNYALFLADGSSYLGTGARVQNGRLKIHDQSSNGKVDVDGQANGTLAVSIRGKDKKTFSLTLAPTFIPAC